MEEIISQLPDREGFDAAIAGLTERAVKQWHASPVELPAAMPTYGRGQKRSNERRILEVLDDPERRTEIQNLLMAPGKATGSALRKLALMNVIMLPEGGDGLGKPAEQFADATTDFIRRAREFDPEISQDDLAQALRNLWVFGSFRYIADLPIIVTPSALGYSLLYPFTDNLLDDSSVPLAQKKEFGRRIGVELKLPGQIPATESEAKVFALIRLIEEEYPHAGFPLIHKSLQAIHAAQSRSIAQQECGSAIDVIPLSMEKGGTSVLADAFLAGTVSDGTWLDMAFGYGCVLQLVDDFQDAEKDHEREHRTLFSAQDYAESPEQKLMHLFSFLYDIVTSWSLPSGNGRASFKRLMADSCAFLLLEAVARSRHLFSPAFLERLAPHAPVRLDFLAGLRERAQNGPTDSGVAAASVGESGGPWSTGSRPSSP